MTTEYLTLSPIDEAAFQLAKLAFHDEVRVKSEIGIAHATIRSYRKLIRRRSQRLKRLSLGFYRNVLSKKVIKLKSLIKKKTKAFAAIKVLKQKVLHEAGPHCKDRILNHVFGLKCEYCGRGKNILTVLPSGYFCFDCVERQNTTPTQRPWFSGSN